MAQALRARHRVAQLPTFQVNQRELRVHLLRYRQKIIVARHPAGRLGAQALPGGQMLRQASGCADLIKLTGALLNFAQRSIGLLRQTGGLAPQRPQQVVPIQLMHGHARGLTPGRQACPGITGELRRSWRVQQDTAPRLSITLRLPRQGIDVQLAADRAGQGATPLSRLALRPQQYRKSSVAKRCDSWPIRLLSRAVCQDTKPRPRFVLVVYL